MRSKKFGDLANRFVILSDLSQTHMENKILFERYHKQSEIFDKKTQVPENAEYPTISTFQF